MDWLDCDTARAIAIVFMLVYGLSIILLVVGGVAKRRNYEGWDGIARDGMNALDSDVRKSRERKAYENDR